jgi:hypothetical protein
MSEEMITDQSEVMLLPSEELDGASYQAIPLVRAVPPTRNSDDGVICDWCGVTSRPLPGCEACGYPLS